MEIIGGGRVGTAVKIGAEAAGIPVKLYCREGRWSSLMLKTGPILVAVRNDDLSEVLSRVPSHRHRDLVFVQNGMYRHWLAENNLIHATRGLLFFAVSSRGEVAVPGGVSPFVGCHAEAMCEIFNAINLPAEAVSNAQFSQVEFEKLLWNCIFCLLSERLSVTVGALAVEHTETVQALYQELLLVGASVFGRITDPEAMFTRLLAYSKSISAYRGTMKEWDWRNGWFVAEAQKRGIATPLHTSHIDAVKVQRS